MIKNATSRKAEQGFTLVELAIVMIIIGLLIGGILKGQELIVNARVASTVAQIKGMSAATTTFQDKYNALPGDMLNVAARLQNCAAAPCLPGAPNGNGRVDVGGGFGGAPTGEALAFFLQLAAADLLNGVVAGNNVWSQNFPAADIAGGYHASYWAGGAAAALPNVLGIAPANVRAGHYLALHNTPNGTVGNTGVITPNQAFRIDTKLDDGNPTSGSVFPAGAGACIAGTVYNEVVDVANCNLYIRFTQ
jgi:prepilin-type N-terminal cleavage/methylation domain-containing protein